MRLKRSSGRPLTSTRDTTVIWSGETSRSDSPSLSPSPTRQGTLARFDVDVRTGKVTVTQADPARPGRAVFTGGSVSFSSSDLVVAGGDSGQRQLRLRVLNNSNQTFPAQVRVVLSNLVSNIQADAKKKATLVRTYAGTLTTSGSDNGYGTAARFYNPISVAPGNGPSRGALFVADLNNHTIRKIEPDGQVTTFAGTATSSGFVDATGSAARFTNPRQRRWGGQPLYRRLQQPTDPAHLPAGRGNDDCRNWNERE